MGLFLAGMLAGGTVGVVTMCLLIVGNDPPQDDGWDDGLRR